MSAEWKMTQDLNDELAQVSTTLFTQRGSEKGGVELMLAVSRHKNTPRRTSARHFASSRS